MVKNVYLNQEYYRDNLDNILAVPSSLNCLNGTLYFHCKVSLNPPNLATAFIQRTDLCIAKDLDNNFVHLGSVSYTNKLFFEKNVLPTIDAFDLTLNQSTGIEGIKEIEKKLDEGKILSLDTYTDRLEFYLTFKSLDTEFDSNTPIPSHFILLIGHSNDQFFYVEDPSYINYMNYQMHTENRYVGVINKSSLLCAMNIYSNAYEVSLNKDKIQYYTSFNYFKSCLAQLIQAYQAEPIKSDEHVFFYGKLCYSELISMLSDSSTKLSRKFPGLDHLGAENLKSLLSWQFHDVYSAKKVLLFSVEEWYSSNKTLIMQELIANLKVSIFIWESLCKLVGMGSDTDRLNIKDTLVIKIEQADVIEALIIKIMKDIVNE